MFYFNKYETRTFELAKLIKREEDVNVLYNVHVYLKLIKREGDVNVLYNVYVYLNVRKMLMYCILYMFT